MNLRNILTLTISSFLGLALSAQTTVNNGPVSGTWTVANAPYHVHGEITVYDTLIIEPGVEVFFHGYHSLRVYGKLLAQGTSSDSIYFLPAPNVDYWKGFYIQLSDSTDSTIIDRSVIRYSKSQESPSYDMAACFSSNRQLGAVTIRGVAPVRISNSELTHNLGFNDTITNGLFSSGAITLFDGARPLISHNFIGNNDDLCGIYVGSGYPQIIGNEIAHNNAEAGAGISCWPTGAINVPPPFGVIVHDNYIHHNTEDEHYGGGIAIRGLHKATITNNRIAYNSGFSGGGGLSTLSCDSIEIRDNLIVNNQTTNGACGITDGGGGVSISGGEFLNMQNNIVCNNYSTLSGGAVHIVSVDTGVFNNNILANNSAYSWAGGLSIWYSNLQSNNNLVHNNISNSTGTSHTVFATNSNYTAKNENWVPNDIHANTSNFDSLDISTYSPQFISPSPGIGPSFDGLNADWHIDSTSQLINAGNTDTITTLLSSHDYDGQDRISGPQVDIGAFEFQEVWINDTTDTTVIDTNDTGGGGDTNNVGWNNIQYNNIAVYPNPAADHFFIEGLDVGETVEIYDLLGRRRLKVGVQQRRLRINVEALDAGTYFIRVNGEKAIKRISITR